jgi:hypothetical protein
MRLIRRIIRFISTNFNFTAAMSVLAIVISVVTMYYQFFNVRHELIYSFLTPSVDKKMVIPIIYKNEGNQNEMILESKY